MFVGVGEQLRLSAPSSSLSLSPTTELEFQCKTFLRKQFSFESPKISFFGRRLNFVLELFFWQLALRTPLSLFLFWGRCVLEAWPALREA